MKVLEIFLRGSMIANLIYVAGWLQLMVLIASALVPLRLKWKETFRDLPRLHRQLYWVYGGYVVLAIIFNGLVCIFNSTALADGSMLSRFVCGYLAAFWGIRLCLQKVLDVEQFLTCDILRYGYYLLTVLFTLFTIMALFGVLH